MRATIVINLDNDAFQDCAEIELGRILHAVARQIEENRSHDRESLLDANGNTVGYYELTD